MKPSSLKTVISAVVLVGVLAAAAWVISEHKSATPDSARKRGGPRVVPVEVAQIEHGPIVLRRTFSGELEALAEFVVAPKVSGRIARMNVDIADPVARGQVVATLDDDEYVQAVAQARADQAVARANLSEAESALNVAQREFERTASLLKRGIASDSEFDSAQQALEVRKAQLAVAQAQMAKAEASLEAARIRLGYTQVAADWAGAGDRRVVAERYVDEGQTVTANTPLLLIVERHPILGVIAITEKEYSLMEPGQAVALTTDAFPGEQFSGRINRIAPIFRKTTRQARVEILIDNPGYRLKPGMFIRATVVLKRIPDAVLVPVQALTKRDDRDGVFVVRQDGRTVAWREITIGVREGDRVQVSGQGLTGRVVTLGQQLVGDGSPITIPAENNPSPSAETAEQSS